jgi:hypothetical protein
MMIFCIFLQSELERGLVGFWGVKGRAAEGDAVVDKAVVSRVFGILVFVELARELVNFLAKSVVLSS